MSARSSIVRIVAKAGMLLGALFVFTLLLAALPAHRARVQQESPQELPAQAPDADHGSMPGMDMSDEHANEKAAVREMTPGHHDAHGQHMTMTATRVQTPEETGGRGSAERACAAEHCHVAPTY
jgi:hypothetical protein